MLTSVGIHNFCCSWNSVGSHGVAVSHHSALSLSYATTTLGQQVKPLIKAQGGSRGFSSPSKSKHSGQL